jgi:hypothetical protein
MSPHPRLHALLRYVCLVVAIACAGALRVRAQEVQPPAYLAVVTGEATIERAGESEPATANMPFVAGDRLRTGAGRVEIAFPDGTAIEVGEQSEVEAVSATRVRLMAGTMDHIQRPAAPSRSASYLPQDLQTYGSTFDQYGSWQYDQPYGYVWYPQVEADWRPYSYGSWSPIRSYGWTWVGAEAWAWPTHHYGRWGFARNAWFWIPGRTWGAAWVSWSFADDYVSWCPLGWNSRPVFALSIGSRHGWGYWTVPRRTFETRGYGRSYAAYYRNGSRGGFAGREPFNGNRTGRSAPREPWTNADRQSSAGLAPSRDGRFGGTGRQSSQPGMSRPAGNLGAIAVPRAGTGDPVGNRDSGFGTRDSGFGMRPPSTNDGRPLNGYRRPTTESRLPAIDARQGPAVAAPRASAPERGQMSPSFRAREQSSRPIVMPAPQSNLPAANGGVIAMPRAGARDTDARPPATDSRRRDAPAASAPRAMPHERAAPAGGEARAQGQGRRR